MAVPKDWITLRNIRVDQWHQSGEEHRVKAFGKKDKYERQCPECDARHLELSPAGTDGRQLYDVPLRKSLYIELDRKRFECECGKYITPNRPNIYRGRKMSVKLVRYIWKSHLRGHPFWEIAERSGLATSTVQDVFQERVEIMGEPLTPTSATVLSIDEIYFKDHGHLDVFVDLKSRDVVEMVQGMSTEAVLPFL